VSAGLLVPAIPLVAQEADPPAADASRPTLTPSNVRPDAALSSSQADGRVAFDASASADSDGSIVLYEWDLDGDSAYETKTGAEPRVEHAYDPGTTLIAAVRITDDAGASDEATAAVVVAAAPEPAAPDAPAAAPDEAPSAAQTPASSGAALVPTGELVDQEEPRAVKSSRESARTDDEDDSAEESDPKVVAAASGSVTISDFEFSPTTVNVNVGDSVTWRNQGPTVHTATADDGSFDSGNLNKGQSYSHKFTKAGTISYLCKPHPFMKAKVVVAGAGASGSGGGSDSGSGSGSGGSGGGSGDAAGAGADSGSSGDLAKTGADLIPWSLFGFSLLLFGIALRYRLTE
jgi:plastocyanin